jgi:hypothetical protein
MNSEIRVIATFASGIPRVSLCQTFYTWRPHLDRHVTATARISPAIRVIAQHVVELGQRYHRKAATGAHQSEIALQL